MACTVNNQSVLRYVEERILENNIEERTLKNKSFRAFILLNHENIPKGAGLHITC